MHIITMLDGVTATVTPRGELDHDTLPLLRAAAAELPDHVTRVTWDLREIHFMDSAGLHLLTDPPASDGGPARSVSVTGLTAQTRRLLSLAADVFPTEDFAQFLANEHAVEQAA
ncbi:STAS domain-containing protein [Streptomyces sp. NPDC101181]|uniref:STAS domain-containing protein n=1 Tax=Streptomyces sp. NPDC101181 TaxID=3366125 RepID=UPI003810032A